MISEADPYLLGYRQAEQERLQRQARQFAGDVTPFIGPGLMRVGGCGHAAAPC